MPLRRGEVKDVLASIVAGAVPADIEGDQLDFKRQPGSKGDAIRTLVDAAVCFANSGGGTVVMGCRECRAGPEAIVGCSLDPAMVQRRIHELTEPPLMVGARNEEVVGRSVLVVDVLQSFEIHADRQGRGSYRLAVERLVAPLVMAFDEAMKLIWARRNVTPLTLPNGQQIEIADFPEAAVREALSNAVIHRDYRISQPVNLEHTPSAFVVISPGPLVGSVTSDNILTHASTPRNPVLARAARLLRLAEGTGRGVDRMFREMIRAGQDPPVIEEGIDYVRVLLAGGAPRTSVKTAR